MKYRAVKEYFGCAPLKIFLLKKFSDYFQMSQLRTVRFSDQPAVAHSAAMQPDDRPTSSLRFPLPTKYDDALYAKYDTYTAASLGECAFVEVRFFIFNLCSIADEAAVASSIGLVFLTGIFTYL